MKDLWPEMARLFLPLKKKNQCFSLAINKLKILWLRLLNIITVARTYLPAHTQFFDASAFICKCELPT